MVYITFLYYIFTAFAVILYYLFPMRHRWYVLLAGSMLFYWYISQYSKKRFLVLILLAFLVWLAGICAERYSRLRKMILGLSVTAVAALLILSKEMPLIMDAVLHGKGQGGLLMPVGFSFFTMQLISYCADVYRGGIRAERSFPRFLLFISFFPQIVQGPIPRYGQLSRQLTEGHRFDEKGFVRGFMLILWGFFLKLCIADKAGIIVDTVFNNYPAYQGMYILTGGTLYSFQLYTDFLSCTCLAQGVSGLFGITLSDNFARPYLAVSIKDFWRRWHISLSSWLRDYVYIPLGGNRRGKLRKNLNILITFAVSGVWHGGGVKFLFWGLLHGIYQVIGDLLPMHGKNGKAGTGTGKTYPSDRFLRSAGTFCLVMPAWIIFRADSLRTGLSMIRSIFTVFNPWILTDDSLFRLGLGWKEVILLIVCLLILLAVSLLQEKGVRIRERVLSCSLPVRWGIYIGAVLFIMVFGTYGWGFDARSFIYGGF